MDHASRLPSDIGMMGNDVYGNCTVAAAGHAVQSWSLYAERGMKTIPNSDILKAYFAISPNDEGAYMLDLLNYWRKSGIGDDIAEAFVEIDISDLTQVKLAIDYFGSAYVGMCLPDENTFGPWTSPTGAPNPNNGHAIEYLAYDDARQMFKVATWGEVWDLSYAWHLKYADEGYTILNDISINLATNKSPEGFSYAELQNDLSRIGDPITPEPTPDPAPVPDPEPTPEPEPVPVPDPSSSSNAWIYAAAGIGILLLGGLILWKC